ncbi:DEAD/DEAH box helicase [Devosia sp.]|uniref:DEAD/DEAH box helicase n=1 Tax=Devosia sp. TaxID=1871048 RepID=UPI003BAAB927
MIEIVYGDVALTDLQKDLVSAVKTLETVGTLYIGYPILNSTAGNVEVDALLVSRFGGIVAMDLSSDFDDGSAPSDKLIDRQNQLFAALTSKLALEKSLVARRKLVLDPVVVTITDNVTYQDDDVLVWAISDIAGSLSELPLVEGDTLAIVNSVVERAATLRPRKARQGVKKQNSRGKVLKEIESKIANLDASQKRAAIEFPGGPQRIRGLAGSGKTIVLAMKASYLHLKNPEWRIAITFYTRSLYQQFTRLVTRFSYEFIRDEPDWSKVNILHSWGSSYSWGVYAEMATAVGAPVRDYRYAKQRWGYGEEFQGVINELLKFINDNDPKIESLYDVLLIDEAQDLPQGFFELAYMFTSAPHRIVYAYDELQTLNDTEMASPERLFGRNKSGRARVTLSNQEGQPKQDITLPVCYRNTPWSLSTAHGLGFGVARSRGLVQMFESPDTWRQIGYDVSEGSLALGKKVSLVRGAESTPTFFSQYLTPSDATKFRKFGDVQAQYDWIAEQIEKNVTDDELEYDDILVIFCETKTIRSTSAELMKALSKRKVRSHLVGVTESADEVFSPKSIALTHIFRAKGNEASMVYVVNADYCAEGYNIGTLRNVLFTAITRSRAWVRVTGVGDRMEALTEEFSLISGDDYRLTFKYPTKSELTKIKTRYRVAGTPEGLAIESDLESLSRVIGRLESGKLDIQDLPPDVLKTLKGLIK